MDKIVIALRKNSFFLEEAERRRDLIFSSQYYKIFGSETIRRKDLNSNDRLKLKLFKSRLVLIEQLNEGMVNEVKEINYKIKAL